MSPIAPLPTPATDVEDIGIGTKTPQTDEELPKLVSGGAKVPAPDEPQAASRRERVASAKGGTASVEDSRAYERRRAHEADVLEFAAELPRY